MRIAIVSREVHPLAPGGIGAYVTSLANVLAREAEVTIVTTDRLERRWHDLRGTNHALLPSPDVRMAFVAEPEPEEVPGYLSFMHLYSARVHQRLRELYGEDGPDVIEFSDYLGEGAVTLQASRTRASWLRDTTLLVKLHTTTELVAILNGRYSDANDDQVIYELERFSLANADVLFYGGGDVYGTYQRYYGAETIAPGRCVRQPVPDVAPAGTGIPDEVVRGEAPVKLLYLGRLERRKGVQNLVRSLTGTPSDEFRLTLVGGDTTTGPLQTSMRRQLEFMISGDERFTFLDEVDRREIPRLFEEHHAVVLPSRWECWPNVGLEALRANRPIISTPVGGLTEMGAGDAGWATDGSAPEDIWAAVEDVIQHRDRLAELVERSQPRRRFEELTDEDNTLKTYAELAAQRPREVRRPAPRSKPLVSIVIPYFRLDRHIETTVRSAFAQTHRPIEVIIVNDGSTREQDRILQAIATRYPVRVVSQANAGLSAARNMGISVSRGRYVLPLDADNEIEPTFVERCLEVLENDPDVAYVTSWTRYIDEDGVPHGDGDEGYQPITNMTSLMKRQNVAGDAVAVMRRRIFDLGFEYDHDLTSYEDWVLYRELADAGYVGHAIPERLIRYRIRALSMLRQIGMQRQEVLDMEMNAHMRRKELEWTS